MTATFRLLGTVEADIAGRPVDLGPARQQCVLVGLLVDLNHVVPVDQLLTRVWGDHPPHSARSTLSSYLSRLRRALAASDDVAIRRQSGGYLLTGDPALVDLHQFHQLIEHARAATDDDRAAALFQEALRLWRGDAFAALDTPWLNQLRAALDAERRTAELDHNDLQLRLGRHGDLLAHLSTRAGAHPLDERLAGQLMLALYRAGRQADALQVFHDTRTALVDQLGLEPGPDLRQLHQRMLAADSTLTITNPVDRTVRVESVHVPRQLPADITHFCGRAAELINLVATWPTARDGQQPTTTLVISALDGMAGVGKTALAVRAAHQLAAEFPDGQLFLDLRGFHPDQPPVDPGEALGQFLRALGVDPQRIPSDEDERAALFRTTLAGKRMLVVLDNAATVDQVRPLLPGTSSCRVVVTSRNQLAGLVAVDGARHLSLDVLSPAEAMTLLEAMLGQQRVAAEPEAAARLCRLCGHLPLALRVAAGKLIVRPAHPITAVADELDDHGGLAALEIADDRRAGVRAAFDLSYTALEPAAQRMFGLLGLVPGMDFTRVAAAALADVPVAIADRLLDRLTTVNLVESHAVGRFRLHDLLRRYARDRCGDDAAAPIRRLLDWYLTTARAAADVVYPELCVTYGTAETTPGDTPFADKPAAWAWLEAERTNLVAAVSDAARRGLSGIAWRLVDVLRGFFLIRTYHDVWRTAAHTALRAAQTASDEQGQAVMHLNLATAHWGLGDDDGHLEHSARALDLARQIGWTLGQAKALSNIGNARRGQGHLRRALDHLEQALALRRELGSPAGIAHDLILLGYSYSELGDLRRSLEALQEAYELAKAAGAALDETVALHGLGRVQLALGQPDAARQSFTASLTGARELGNRDREAYNLGALAEIAHDTGQGIEAIRLLQEALTLIPNARRQTRVDVLNMAGRIMLGRGQPRTAVDHHRRALDLARRIGDRSNEADALLGLARTQLKLGDHDNAAQLSRQALTIAAVTGYRALEGQALTTLAEVALAKGNRRQATEYGHRALELHRATGHRPGEERTLLLLGN